MPPSSVPEIVSQCLKHFEIDRQAHSSFEQKVNRRLDVYRGVLDFRSEAASWTNKLAPRYAYQIIETMVASLLDPNPKWRLKCRPRIDSPEEVAYYREGAKAHELLLGYQTEIDHFAAKQRAFGLQGLIAGLTIGKCYWNYARAERTRNEVYMTAAVMDDYGEYSAPYQSIRPVSAHEVVNDDPTFEVCDVRDVIPQKGAISLERASRISHRADYTYDELKRRECQTANGLFHEGPCVGGIYHNVDDLRDTGYPRLKDKTAKEGEGGPAGPKDFIQVLECWIEHGRRVATIGNEKILLADRPNPNWHGSHPFVAASSAPDLFTIPGTSEIEVIADLQEMIWSLLNQSLDNLQLVNNAIVMYGAEVQDMDDFEFYPGARWPVRPDQVQMWSPQPISTQIAMPMMDKLKDDLQNIPGASATLLGQVDPSSQTATEISTTTSLAMRRVLAKKQQFSLAYKAVGEQWIELNQQYVQEDRVLQIVGPGGEPYFHTVSPQQLQGRYYIDIESMDESMIRQQRTAEATSKFQVFMGSVQIFAALHQADPRIPLPNMKAHAEDVLEAYGISDKDRYWMPPAPNPQAALQAQGGPPQPGGPPPGDPNANGAAQTAPQATDMNAPSNAFSQSPVAALQRQMAMSGGPANA